MNIIKTRKIWFAFSGTLFILSVAALIAWGLKAGVDFTGGTLLEIKFKNTPERAQLQDTLRAANVESQIQLSNTGSVIIRSSTISEEQHQNVISKLEEKFGELNEERFNSIGPVIGQELKNKSILAVIVVTIMILLYITWSFRHVSRPVPSFVYGSLVIVSFIHDVIIPLGVFAFLGHYYNLEVEASFIAAILTILGYSINDTIVVLDRVRENLRRVKGTFEEVVEASVHQTISRSINTSLTVILALLAIYFFGGASIKNFALALMIGVFFGTYSSIFIVSPLLVVWQKWRKLN
ncbi:MAG: protein translocase subunit SecF [bacterium]|nr:protein translocase subunit SecF [bacterium]